MVNYYELLEVARNASNDEISSAIKKARRLWNNRANNPDAKIRAEAELRVREIAEAENILLDDAKRAEYNKQLAENRKTAPSGTGAEVNDDWEEEYFTAYDRDMIEFAVQLAHRAVQANDRDGRAWFLYGEALRRNDRTQEAIAALQRATILSPRDAGAYRQLGFAYSASDRLGDAIDAWGEAAKRDPEDNQFHCLRAELFRELEMVDEALAEARKARKIDPDDNDAKFELFFALYADALRSMSYNRSAGKHLIINKVQLDYVKKLLDEMVVNVPNNQEKSKCDKALNSLMNIIADAESRKGGFLSSKVGYQYNYDTSSAQTRATGKH